MAKVMWVLGLASLGMLFAMSGRVLVVNGPQPADVILVLAGETDARPRRALQLLDQGYASRLILDVPAGEVFYGWSGPELAQRYLQTLPEKQVITICPIYGLSTQEESKEALRCAQQLGARRILLVTSDFHTRRARDIFRHVGPGYTFAVAAAFDPRSFGTHWWKHREWAKTNVGEWVKWIWWEAVDRWR